MHAFLRRSRTPTVLLAGAFCGLPLSGFAQRAKSPTPSASAAPTPTPQYDLPETVATVNGQAIHKADLERITESLLNASGRSLKTLSINDQKAAYRQMLNSLVVDRLVTAQAAGEKVEDMEVENRLEGLRRQYADPAGFEADIKRSGQTLEQIRQNIRNQIAREHWLDKQIANDIIVAPREVEKFYQDGPSNKFDEPEKISASHLLIKVRRDAPPEDVVAAEKRINDAAERIKKGEAFDVVALQLSDDPTVKKNKGDVGWFDRQGVMPEFANAAFSLKTGEVSAPVRTQFGFHLIKLNDRRPAHNDTLDEARARITTYLQEQKRQKATTLLVQKLKDGATVDVTPDLREGAQPTPTP